MPNIYLLGLNPATNRTKGRISVLVAFAIIAYLGFVPSYKKNRLDTYSLSLIPNLIPLYRERSSPIIDENDSGGKNDQKWNKELQTANSMDLMSHSFNPLYSLTGIEGLSSSPFCSQSSHLRSPPIL